MDGDELNLKSFARTQFHCNFSLFFFSRKISVQKYFKKIIDNTTSQDDVENE